VLRGFIRQMFATLAEKSVKRKVATLKALFHYLEREDAIAHNPFRKMDVRIREARRVPRTIAWKDIQAFFRYLYRQKATESRDSGPYRKLVRDIALFEILFATGARVSEICGLTIDAVDLDGGRIRIFGKGSRERTIDLCDPEVLATLREYQRLLHAHPMPGGGYFFPAGEGTPVSDQTVRGSLRRHVRAAGLDVHITPHMFRHSVATLLLEEGVDIRYIQRILGHSSLVTTQIYTRVHDSEQRRILTDKHPRRRLRTSIG
jgi:integrase/recombinase XerD